MTARSALAWVIGLPVTLIVSLLIATTLFDAAFQTIALHN